MVIFVPHFCPGALWPSYPTRRRPSLTFFASHPYLIRSLFVDTVRSSLVSSLILHL